MIRCNRKSDMVLGLTNYLKMNFARNFNRKFPFSNFLKKNKPEYNSKLSDGVRIVLQNILCNFYFSIFLFVRKIFNILYNIIVMPIYSMSKKDRRIVNNWLQRQCGKYQNFKRYLYKSYFYVKQTNQKNIFFMTIEQAVYSPS